MAVPIAAIAGIAMKILPMLMGGGSIGRSDLSSKDSYYNQLLSMISPESKNRNRNNSQTVQGEEGLGGIENLQSLMGLLKGGNIPKQEEYNPFNNPDNNDWNMEGYGG